MKSTLCIVNSIEKPMKNAKVNVHGVSQIRDLLPSGFFMETTHEQIVRSYVNSAESNYKYGQGSYISVINRDLSNTLVHIPDCCFLIANNA